MTTERAFPSVFVAYGNLTTKRVLRAFCSFDLSHHYSSYYEQRGGHHVNTHPPRSKCLGLDESGNILESSRGSKKGAHNQ